MGAYGAVSVSTNIRFMKIIAECGATKSDWRLIDGGKEIKQVLLSGINVSAMSMDAVKAVVDGAMMQLCAAGDAVASIHLYVAGVVTDEIHQQLNDILVAHCPSAPVEIQTDLVAAARAACGHAPGIAAIIGTGSNSCQFDGEKIVKRVAAGGFILGDEGSAAALGRLFLSDFIKGLVPAEVADDFSSHYPSDYATIVEKVYCSQSPSAYLGSLAPFIMEHYAHPYIKELVDGNFRSFIRRSLKQYDTEGCPVGVVGGFAYALKDVFSRIASEEDVRITRFVKAPIEGLLDYHC